MASQKLISAYVRNHPGMCSTIEGLSTYADRCFFLRRELGRTKTELKASGHYQHVKFSLNKHRGRIEFLEYASSKVYYTTLEEWLETTGCSRDDVLYGRQDFDGRNTYITLAELLTSIGYHETPAEAPTEAPVDDLTRLFEKLRTNSVPIEQITVPKIIMVPKTVMVTGDVYLME